MTVSFNLFGYVFTFVFTLSFEKLIKVPGFGKK